MDIILDSYRVVRTLEINGEDWRVTVKTVERFMTNKQTNKSKKFRDLAMKRIPVVCGLHGRIMMTVPCQELLTEWPQPHCHGVRREENLPSQDSELKRDRSPTGILWFKVPGGHHRSKLFRGQSPMIWRLGDDRVGCRRGCFHGLEVKNKIPDSRGKRKTGARSLVRVEYLRWRTGNGVLGEVKSLPL